MIAIIFGATGATGTALLEQLIIDDTFKKIIVFTRTPIKITDDKIEENLVDFNNIEKWSMLIKGDIIFSALGTTKKEAGSKEAQYLVDFTYQYNVARAGAENEVQKYLLVSSIGANSNSKFFYPKIKGELEDAVKKLNFQNIHVLQPPVLIRQKDKIRAGEKSFINVLNKLNKLGIMLSQKPMDVNILAAKMIDLSKKDFQQKVSTHSVKNIFN
tara:strand:- start:5368 stop:6009 length:642 start_codon:yes stop_codon:yes gene_type:complete